MDNDGHSIDVESAVSAKDGKPFCQLTLDETTVQMRPDKVREVAAMMFEAAIEAERDAATVYMLISKAGFDQDDAAHFLHGIRQERKKFEHLA